MSEQTPETTTDGTVTGTGSPAAAAVAVFAALAALASLVMTIAHLDISVPPLMQGVDVPPFVPGMFAVATVACVVVLVGALRRARWGWWAGLVVFGLAVPVILGSPTRNWLSYLVLATAIVALVVLVSPPGRRAYAIGSA
jgi:hypothetical protein